MMVTSVLVLVLDEQGKVLEKGDWWEYTPTAEGKLVVEAQDLTRKVVKVMSTV